MRLKEKLNEEKMGNSKTDEILLKAASKAVFPKILKAIDNYMHQVTIPKELMKEKKKIAYRTIVENLKSMENNV